MAKNVGISKVIDHYIAVTDGDFDHPLRIDVDVAEELYSHMEHEKNLNMVKEVYPGMSAKFQRILTDLYETKLRKSSCLDDILELAMQEMREMYGEEE